MGSAGRSNNPLWAVGRAPRLARGKAVVTERFMPAAIRIPERMRPQLALVSPSSSPQLFVHEGARQALERRLQAAFPHAPVSLSITDNRHAIISHRTKDGILRARIHHMFLDAPPNVVDALIRYVTKNDREASALLGRYIEANAGRLQRRSRKAVLVTKGRHHDLYALFQDINDRYFDGGVNAVITWGKHSNHKRDASKPRATIKLGSYDAVERLVRVHPALDRAWVPRYFVAYIVYHEMLHHVIPASRGVGRSLLHPPAFREREREFRHFDRAIAWEKKYIGRLLRS
jgi:hypothetical protein